MNIRLVRRFAFYCFLFTALLPGTTAFAQKVKIDSLERVLASGAVRDTARARTLIDLCYEYLNSGSAKALGAAAEASSIAAKSGNKALQIRSAIAMGNASSQQKKLTEARSYIENGLAMAENLRDDQLIASALNALSILYRKSDEQGKALVCAEKALTFLEKTGDKAGICQTLFNIGNIYLAIGKYPQALDALRRCDELGVKEGFPEASAKAAASMGMVYQRLRQYDEALKFYSKAADAHAKLKNAAWQASAISNASWMHHLLENNAEALTGFEKALAMYVELGDKKNIANTSQTMGRVFFRMGRYDEADSCYNRALSIWRGMNDSRAESGLLNDMGNVPLVRNELKKASEIFKRSLKLHEEFGNKAGQQIAILNLGIIEHQQGRTETADEYFQQSLALARELKDPGGIAKCLNNIAKSHLDRGRPEQALEYFSKSLELARNEKLSDEAMILSNIASTHASCGRIHLAMKFNQQALEIAERRDDKRIIVAVLLNMVKLLWDQKRYDEAEEYNDRALKMSREMRNKRGIASAYANHALDLNRLGKHDEAMRYVNMSTELFEEAQDNRGLAGAYQTKGAIYRDISQAESALEYSSRSLRLREKTADAEGTANSLIELALLLTDRGRLDSARALCNRARNIARQSGFVQILKNATKMLSDISVREGDYIQAYDHFQEFVTLKDSLLNESTARTIAELAERYQSSQKTLENSLLQKELKLSELERSKARDQLRLRDLEARQKENRLQEISLENDMLQLETAKAEADAAQRNAINLAKQKENDNLMIIKELQQKEIQNQKLLQNGLIIGIVLIVLLAIALVNRFRQKQRLSELRAKEAEFMAQSATMQAMGISLEAERKERAMQQQFARRLLATQEEERARIARELHDSLSQGLIVMKNRAMMGMRSVDNKEKLLSQLQAISDAASDSLKDVRQISRDLRPHQLDQLGITEALRSMIQAMSDSSDMSVDIHLDSIDGIFSRENEIAIFRIVQEAMNNIHKHAAAQYVEVRLNKLDNTVSMTIRDDGQGFDVSSVAATGFGIQGMGERIRILGGRMNIESRPGAGTTVTLTLPTTGEDTYVPGLGSVRRLKQDGMRAI